MAAGILERHQLSLNDRESTSTLKGEISVQVARLPVLEPSIPGPKSPLQDSRQEKINEDPDFLISSPYPEESHRLRLSTLDVQSSLFARALQVLDAPTPDYATTAYPQALNWDTVLSRLRELSKAEGHTWTSQSFYVVAFFSKLKQNINRDRLAELDKNSHREAAISGGLLKYWFGSPNAERRNLATCLWRSQADAREGGKGDGHREAMMETPGLYEFIDFMKMSFTVHDDARSFSTEVLHEHRFDYRT